MNLTADEIFQFWQRVREMDTADLVWSLENETDPFKRDVLCAYIAKKRESNEQCSTYQ